MDALRVQLADRIAAKIADGTFPPKSRIPSASALADQYGVSPRTAADAVKILKERGLVRGVQGRGVFVLPDVDA